MINESNITEESDFDYLFSVDAHDGNIEDSESACAVSGVGDDQNIGGMSEVFRLCRDKRG